MEYNTSVNCNIINSKIAQVETDEVKPMKKMCRLNFTKLWKGNIPKKFQGTFLIFIIKCKI